MRNPIIEGDFNVPLNVEIDSHGSRTEKKSVVEKIQDIMLASDLIDIW